ncbi:MAG: hypothetical protein [Bacteriophage sp.]|nr:MAG: hypothetical protein [Bacteriophage sp.]
MAQAYFPSFNIKFTDSNKLPLASGKLYAFYSDGITPAPTYNQAGNPNSHPIILDSSGECQLKGDDTITYTFMAYTSAGALVDTWVGVLIPSGGGGGSTVTMDTIAQGTAYKKITAAQYSALTGGANTTLHYHSADRTWLDITGKPSTFAPSAHATTHFAGSTDPVPHDSTGPQAAAAGVTHGHISAGTQTIEGSKTFAQQVDAPAFNAGTAPTSSQMSATAVSVINTTTSRSSNMQAGALVLTDNNGGSTKSSVTTSVDDTNAAIAVASVDDSTQIQSYPNNASTRHSNTTLGAAAYLGYWDAEYRSAVEVQYDGKTVALECTTASYTPRVVVNAAGVSANYNFPEANSGTYAIATREWVETGYAHNHTQAVAAITWTIQHFKSYYPIIQCVDSSGAVVNGSIQHYSGYSTVTFAFATAGTARAV